MLGEIKSERIKKLKDLVLHTPSAICTERAKIITDTYRQNEDKPVVIKRALAVRDILQNMSVHILPGERIVGNHSSALRAAPIFPEYAVDWIVAELDEFDKRPGDRFLITEEQKSELRSIHSYWKGRTLIDHGLALFPPESLLAYHKGVIRAEGNLTSGDGHIAANFEKVLKMGLSGLKKEAEEVLSSLDTADYAQLKKSHFLRAVLITLDAVRNFANRFADLAWTLAQEEKDETRKKELAQISEICRHVPWQPARTFQEGLQSVWFIQLIMQIESNGHSVSLGRLDQYMYPLYRQDMQSGVLKQDDAMELLENLWIKLYTVNKIRSWSHTKFSAGSPLYQNVTIGGQTPDGKDATNDLSFLCLRSVAATRLTQPNLTVRYHKGLSDEFLNLCVDVIRLGFGMPAFNNDEVIIPSMLNLGVKKEDAMRYSAIGCVEVAVPGKWGYRCTGMSFLNLAKVLLIALNNGTDPDTGTHYIPGKGSLGDFKSFSEVLAAWGHFARYFTRQTVVIDTAVDTALEEMVPDILCSALTDDCIRRGKHIKEGGAVYDFISGLQVGIANLGNSLAAIKKLVFEQNLISQQQLKEALDSDFAGTQGEAIRQTLINKAPKYGQDNDEVDSLLSSAYMEYIDEIGKYHNTRYGRGPIGGKYYAGTSSISANVPSGAVVGATPDGRHAHQPLAEGSSPAAGTDIYGPTAVLKSVSKLPISKITGGVLLNQKISPESLATPESKRKLIAMLRAYFDDLKGFHIQYNIVSKKTLEAAREHPEEHRSLVVRVAGYSAFFTVLSPETQQDIINRTEHVI